jgi:hypothetical protein
MTKLFSLGKMYISDFIKHEDEIRSDPVELDMILDEKTGLVRLGNVAPFDKMYGKYWYRSGINDTMRKELKSIVDSVTNVIKLKENDVWLDIACNDGTLLSYVPKNLLRIGIDPADDSFKKESENHANLIIQNYFSSSVIKNSKFGFLKAKVITSIAMFYDLENPELFLSDLYEILDDNGLWVLQLSYTPLMIHQLAFDNICHEHIYYYSLNNIKNLLEKCGFSILDVQLNDVNGGSFRVYVKKKNSSNEFFGTKPHRDVCSFRVNSLLEYEKTLNIDKKETWIEFFNKIKNLKKTTVDFIKQEKLKGKKIWAYGASTKGNTLLQYFNLDDSLIDGVAERNIQKFGLKTIGTNIPIYSESEMRKTKPDYLLILPWHFINEFIEREMNYLKDGGKFIVPCPDFKIIGIGDI